MYNGSVVLIMYVVTGKHSAYTHHRPKTCRKTLTARSHRQAQRIHTPQVENMPRNTEYAHNKHN